MRAAVASCLAVAVLGAGCAESAAPAGPVGPSAPETVPAAVATISALATRPPCEPGGPRVGLDLQTDRILRLYNAHNAVGLAAIIGDGPVLDPSLQPGSDGRYESVAAWVEAGRAVGDRLDDRGYGFGEPFQLFVTRSNRPLVEHGIGSMTLTLHIWANQDCPWRVEAGDEISATDPCRFHELFAPGPLPFGCAASFEPRASHGAVWTGEEVLIVGGWSGTDGLAPYRGGLAFDPARDAWRAVAEAPVALNPWPALEVVWTGERLLVVGRPHDGAEVTVLAYDPAADAWQRLPSPPPERTAVGAAVWTGSELLFVGGDLHVPDATAWALDPAAGEWRRLPDPGLRPVEGVRGVWTGAEAVFVGGYPAGPDVAYDPTAGTWRVLAPSAAGAVEQHRLAWTGREVIVYSGHVGPTHPDRLLLYDPAADSWRRSARLPIAPAERLAGAWAGDRLLLWGGLATYGEPDADGDLEYGDGAAYFPDSDTWAVLPPSPLSDRCDLSGTWTGEAFVVFGGTTRCGTPGVLAEGDAAEFHPATGSWGLLGP